MIQDKTIKTFITTKFFVISALLILIYSLVVVYYRHLLYKFSPIVFYFLIIILFGLFFLLIYTKLYTWCKLNRSFFSFVFFTINLFQLTLYLSAISFFVNIWYYNQSIELVYLENLSLSSQYRYLFLTIISFFFIIIYLLALIFKWDLQKHISAVTYPYLQEEVRCFIDTWKGKPLDKFFIKIIRKLIESVLYRYVYFSFDLLASLIRFIAVLLFVHCCFFHGNFYTILYLTPITFIIWILNFFQYHINWIIEGNCNFIRECLVLSPLDSSLLPEGKTGFTFKITNEALKEGFSEKDLDFLVNQLLQFGNLATFFNYRRFIRYFSSFIITIYFTSWCYLSYHYFFSTPLEIVMAGGPSSFVAAFRSSPMWKSPITRIPPRDMNLQ